MAKWENAKMGRYPPKSNAKGMDEPEGFGNG